jgi:hypothetical protein
MINRTCPPTGCGGYWRPGAGNCKTTDDPPSQKASYGGQADDRNTDAKEPTAKSHSLPAGHRPWAENRELCTCTVSRNLFSSGHSSDMQHIFLRQVWCFYEIRSGPGALVHFFAQVFGKAADDMR